MERQYSAPSLAAVCLLYAERRRTLPSMLTQPRFAIQPDWCIDHAKTVPCAHTHVHPHAHTHKSTNEHTDVGEEVKYIIIMYNLCETKALL